MSIDIRAITADGYDAWMAAISIPFSFELSAETIAHFRKHEDFERLVAAYDGPAVVGTSGADPFVLAVPGGTVAAGGLTAVTVLPTHRRRGVMRDMMRFHFDDVRDHEEPVSILWAAEWPIYGRFGYGLATEATDLTIDPRRTDIARGPKAAGRVRLVEQEEAEKVLPLLYERTFGRPGMLSRSHNRWQRDHFHDPESFRDGFTRKYTGLYEEDGEALGFVRWRTKADWSEGVANGTAKVTDLQWVTPQAYVGLWNFVLGIDLMGTVKASLRPVDEPLVGLVGDGRAIKRRVSDGLWLAFVDVSAALAARRYREEGELVVEVTDAFVAGVEGTYRLHGGPDGAECARTDVQPDLTLTAAQLGQVYLAGTSVSSLVRWAGARASSDEVVRRADNMFRGHEPPWCPEVF